MDIRIVQVRTRGDYRLNGLLGFVITLRIYQSGYIGELRIHTQLMFLHVQCQNWREI
jgi:hypothetical protein